MSPKAGLFAGEVTPQAPADDSPTSKDKGYWWMEYGVELNNCNEIWDIGTLLPDLHVAGVVAGVWNGEVITGTGLLEDDRIDDVYTTNDIGNYTKYSGFNPGVEDGVAEVFFPECQWYNYSGPLLDNKIAGSTIDFSAWSVDAGTGTKALDQPGIAGVSNRAGVATDTDAAAHYRIRNTSALNSIPQTTEPMTAVLVIWKDDSAANYAQIDFINNEAPATGIAVVFGMADGSAIIPSWSGGTGNAVEVRDNVDWWELYIQTDANGAINNEGVVIIRPAFNTDGTENGDVTTTGSIRMGDHKIFAETTIGMIRGGALEPKLSIASPSSVIDISNEHIPAINHDDSQGGYYIEWRPMYSHSEITRDVEILSLNDSTGLLYYDYATQLLTATDGTNTATIPLVLVKETKYRVAVIFGSSQLRVGVDRIWGTPVAYDGAFAGGSDFTICRNPEAVNYWRELRGFQITYNAAFNEISTLMAG